MIEVLVFYLLEWIVFALLLALAFLGLIVGLRIRPFVAALVLLAITATSDLLYLPIVEAADARILIGSAEIAEWLGTNSISGAEALRLDVAGVAEWLAQVGAGCGIGLLFVRRRPVEQGEGG